VLISPAEIRDECDVSDRGGQAANFGIVASINRKNRWLRSPATTLWFAPLRQATTGYTASDRGGSRTSYAR